MATLMGENKMAEIAALFNKKLDEEFIVKSNWTEGNCIGCFTKYGFEGRNQTESESKTAFVLLMTGKAVIIDEAQGDK